jgi:IMP dehydrogenase
MKPMLLSFDDVLITPRYSKVKSRNDVDINVKIANSVYTLPIIASNMDTITNATMANAMEKNGAAACLHRFWTIEENVNAFKDASMAWVSVGIGEKEFERAKALYEVGARIFIIDVAHGANENVANYYSNLKNTFSDIFLVVGNFANYDSYHFFEKAVKDFSGHFIDGVKLGIGSGAACSTQVVTGCGMPLLETLLDFKYNGYEKLIIADGGMKTSGDIAKAIAAGAHLCMLGNMLAGTEESAGKEIKMFVPKGTDIQELYKEYRGSASKESYIMQNKNQTYISPEGERFLVPYKGSVDNVLQQIAGGLRSSLSYVGASNIKEFQENATFEHISRAAHIEGTPHGKK